MIMNSQTSQKKEQAAQRKNATEDDSAKPSNIPILATAEKEVTEMNNLTFEL